MTNPLIDAEREQLKCCENCKYLFQTEYVICDILMTSTLQANNFFCSEHKFKEVE